MASTLLLLPYFSYLLDGLFTFKTHFEYYLFQEAFSDIIKQNGLLQSLSSHIIGFISLLQLLIYNSATFRKSENLEKGTMFRKAQAFGKKYSPGNLSPVEPTDFYWLYPGSSFLNFGYSHDGPVTCIRMVIQNWIDSSDRVNISAGLLHNAVVTPEDGQEPEETSLVS